ncbi:ABC transporter permease [Tropicimonas isoalkanivorans]|uniref:Monosaccharide ABC transporter membrane protein, CUT2 family (TC 3.A.1.2.-) n=1 Tax=Tropicimonas isoalkanivorans TaxID=441112 RepID=A0A1I1DRA7_9RHOB|nr:ABC transporter permease [Tropicimonas isoalkanivorans]SFB77374.1 monosaccharide ABC transporter membrane protein, CUT2 family (TC 3.A.1.2.-) [Tropicimonas isoalkanivorans]
MASIDTAPKYAKQPIDRNDLIQKFAALAGLVLLVIAFSLANGAFHTMSNAVTIALQTSTIAFIGLGATLTIITAGIDLSLGSVLALAGVVSALSAQVGIPVPIAMLIGVLTGAVCGLFNGLVVTRLKLPPFIATLGMMMIARGVALQITGARPVSGLPESFGTLGGGSLFRIVEMAPNGFPKVIFPGIPYPVILMAILAVAVAVMLRKTSFGRHLYAIGSNEEAARLSGVKVDRVKTGAYILSGAMAGIAGIVLMSRLVTGQPNEGVAYELDAIAAAVIGGTSLAGGVGTISGTIIGAFIIGILRNGLNMNGVSFFIQMIIIGLVIIATVWIDQLRNRK